jgi:glycosyltransferase involved in cell wall biosynthesis
VIHVYNTYDITIIMPSYNKYPENLFTLYSLEYQEYDMSKVQVILIDDNSSDSTVLLKNHSFSFDFVYVRNNNNLGRVTSRNIGIDHAKGRVVIFLDAEILVRPDFLSTHSELHRENSEVIVTGVMNIKKLYSIIYPGFTVEQLNECKELLEKNRVGLSKAELFSRIPQKTILIDKQIVKSQAYLNYSKDSPYELFYEKTIIKNYGYKLIGYRIPWQLFGTGNVSCPLEALKKYGNFANYKGYGWDDCEMGYRLYKKGFRFIGDKRLISYHQEHPISTNNKIDIRENYYKFQETYLATDQMIISLTFLPKPFDLNQVNQILIQYENLDEEFMIFKDIFNKMLRQIGIKYRSHDKITNLFPAVSPVRNNMLIKEINSLTKKNKFNLLIQCFETLRNL